MKHGWLAASTIAFITSTVITLSAADPGVTLVGTGFIPGDALDRSGLAGRPSASATIRRCALIRRSWAGSAPV